jgi:hypothetical protein
MTVQSHRSFRAGPGGKASELRYLSPIKQRRIKPNLSSGATVSLFDGRRVDGVVREQDFADIAEQDVHSLFAVDFLVAVHRDHDGGVDLPLLSELENAVAETRNTAAASAFII